MPLSLAVMSGRSVEGIEFVPFVRVVVVGGGDDVCRFEGVEDTV
jgi:hypothetical protein